MIGRYDGMTEAIPNTLITFVNALMRSCVTLLQGDPKQTEIFQLSSNHPKINFSLKIPKWVTQNILLPSE